jgi:hypothetical protein
MKLPHYKKLSPLNKFFYWASIATFIGLALSVVSRLLPSNGSTSNVTNPQTHGDNSPQYIGGDNTTFNIKEGEQVPKSGANPAEGKSTIPVIIGVALVCILVVVLVWKDGGRTTTATTTSDNSPQYIGGDNTTFNVGTQPPTSAQGILEQNKQIHSRLSEQYPDGWILFNQDRGGRFDPIFSQDLRCEADWTEVRLGLDTKNKKYTLVLPQLSWSRERQTLNLRETRSRPYTGSYEIGKPVLIRTMLWAEGEPLIHLEILDDTTRAPVFVIGFKRQPPGSGPPQYDFKEAKDD